MNRVFVSMLILLIGSFPVATAYFGVGNFEVPGSGPVTDTDGDNIPDWWENQNWWNGTCRLNYTNPADNVTDFDGDGFQNWQEYQLLLNPCLSNNDGDSDGMPDEWEDANGLTKWDPADRFFDPDVDGLINYYEYKLDTDIDDPDTDNDGIPDGGEDTDGDNMPDGWEADFEFNPLNPSDATLDNDTDGVTNLQEYLDGTDPTKAPATEIISPAANVSESIDAQAEAETTLELTTIESLSSVSVNITKYTNISKAVANPLSTTYGLASGQQSIGKGIVISADPNLRNNLSSVFIKVYYTDAELDRTGDGDANDVGDINPATLKFWRYCNETDVWQALDKNQGTVVCGSTIQIFDSGVDTANKFVYANISTLSVFGLVGEKIYDIFEPFIPGGGGGPPLTPPSVPIFKPGVIHLTDALLRELMLSRNLQDRQFFTVPSSVAPIIALTNELPSPFTPLSRALSSSPIIMLLEPLKFLAGQQIISSKALSDIYRFTIEKVLNRYSQSDVVVIAVREPAVDSMAAVAYAKSQDAPILLTEHDDAPEVTINAVRQLNPKKIVIIGGTVAISSDVEAEFKKIAPTERIWGPTRYETAVELAEKLDPSIVVITDGEDPYPDTVIVAAEYKAPIIYVRGKEIPDSTRKFLVKNVQTKKGNPMSWVTAGVDEDVHTELQGLYLLPEFLTRSRLTLKLYQIGTRFLR